MSARALYRRARQWAFRRNPQAGLGFELVGCRTDELSVPLQGSKTAVDGGAAHPLATLRYSPESEEAFLATFWGLKKATLEWYGFSVSDPRAHRIFEDYFWSRQGSAYLCEVRLPEDGVHWNASEFLLHLADALVYTPAVLLFRWPRPLEVERVRWIGSIVNGKWHSVGPCGDRASDLGGEDRQRPVLWQGVLDQCWQRVGGGGHLRHRPRDTSAIELSEVDRL